MRSRSYFPFALASIFGVMNGIYIFKPMMIEARIRRLQEEGADVGAVGSEGRFEEEVRLQNEMARIKGEDRKNQHAEESS